MTRKLEPGLRRATFIALCALSLPAVALETDQYYAWGRELADTTDVINAKINLEISEVLERINARDSWEKTSCPQVVKQILPRFNWFIFQDIELWAVSSPLVDRVPADREDELEFRRSYLYHRTGPLDPGTKIPPSPTIEMNGVRLGTDKLAHFFSQGSWYYRTYHKARKAGLSQEAAELRAIQNGFFPEKTVLGYLWGFFSIADLEANYQGLRFIAGLCEGDAPALEKTSTGWRHVSPFDFRDYVTPEWDESFETSIYGERRWKRVLPVLLGYCPMLSDPEVVRRRADYARRDRRTLTEDEIDRRVRGGALPDPRQFTLESACAARALYAPPDGTR